MKNFKSEIQKTRLDGFEFFVKRDDLLGEVCGGNKARKLEFFIKNAHKFARNTRIISYGSSQSNALAALSEFARQNDFEFVFVCEKISRFLKENPCGNYAYALKNGAKIIENLDFKDRKEKALSLCDKNDIFVPEGVACKEAEMGFETLANEIKAQSEDLKCEFDIFLPSGTGVSALYLAKHSEFRVFTCACVGDGRYLKAQILDLEPNFCVEILDYENSQNLNLNIKNLQNLAKNSAQNDKNSTNSLNFLNFSKNSNEITSNSAKNSALNSAKIFILKTPRKFHFAKPYKELFEIYQRALKDCGIEFSLLYDGVGLLTMLAYKHLFTKPVLYIHQGGANGNPSMLERYKFKHLA